MKRRDETVVLQGGFGNAMLYVTWSVLRYGTVRDNGTLSGVSVSACDRYCEHGVKPGDMIGLFPGLCICDHDASAEPEAWTRFAEVYDASAGRCTPARVGKMELVKDILRKSIGMTGRTPDIGVHIRGRDYLHGSNYPELDGKFLRRALSLRPGPYPVRVFTDDEDYARKVMEPVDDITPVVLYQDTAGWGPVDLIRGMACCSMLVRGASTLSWWAAVLGNVPTVVTTFPVERNWEYANRQVQPGWMAIGL